MKIVVVGNPAAGFQFLGPFSDGETALEWAGKNIPVTETWWIVPLVSSGDMRHEM